MAACQRQRNQRSCSGESKSVSSRSLLAGTVQVEWAGPVGDLGCEFDAEEVCAQCGYGPIYACHCASLYEEWFDYDENMPCVSGRCGLVCGGQAVPTELVGQCLTDVSEPTTGAAYNCSTWEPDELITNTSGNNYAVSGGLVNLLHWDITPLYECDSARVNVSDGLELENAVSTDMAYLLGLRNGDVLVEINGMPLGDPMEALMAYHELWLIQGETSYTLKVQRGLSYVYLNYGIIYVAP